MRIAVVVKNVATWFSVRLATLIRLPRSVSPPSGGDPAQHAFAHGLGLSIRTKVTL